MEEAIHKEEMIQWERLPEACPPCCAAVALTETSGGLCWAGRVAKFSRRLAEGSLRRVLSTLHQARGPGRAEHK